MSRNAFAQCEREYNEREERLENIRSDWGYLPSTSHMLDVIYAKMGIEEGKRRIESVRKADQVRMAVAIAIVYKSIGE